MSSALANTGPIVSGVVGSGAQLKLQGAKVHYSERETPYNIASTRSPLRIIFDPLGKSAAASRPLIDESMEQLLCRDECVNIQLIRKPPVQLKSLVTRSLRVERLASPYLSERSCAAIMCEPLRPGRAPAENVVWVEHLKPTELDAEGEPTFGTQLSQAWQEQSKHARQFHERGEDLGVATHDVYAQRDGHTSAPAFDKVYSFSHDSIHIHFMRVP